MPHHFDQKNLINQFNVRQLLLSVAEPVIRAKLLQSVAEAGLYARIDDLCVRVDTVNNPWQVNLLAALRSLTRPERSSLRVSIIEEPGAKVDHGLLAARNGAELHDLLAERWLLDLLDHRGLTTLFQPIISSRETVFGHECLLRGLGTDGKLIAPKQLFDAARSVELLNRIDRLARLGAIERIASLNTGQHARYFVNVLPSALVDREHSIRSTLSAIQSAGLVPSQFCFEFGDERHTIERSRFADIVRSYRDAGFLICLDGVGDAECPLLLIPELRPDFVKFNGEFVRRSAIGRLESRLFADIAHALLEEGFEVIAPGIETEAQLHFVENTGVRITQGFFWGRPALRPLAPFPVPVPEYANT